MTQHDLTPPPAPAPLPQEEHRSLRGPALLLAICLSGIVAILASLPRTAAPSHTPQLFFPAAPAEHVDFTPAATSLTPITSYTASGPSQLGGSTTALEASADRIDLYVRTSSGSGTLGLVVWVPEDSRWVQHGADCTASSTMSVCRYVAVRGVRYWQVYKASGTMAKVLLDPVLGGGASLGSIEPSGPSSSISLPLSVPNGGTGITSYTAGDLLVATDSTTLAKLGVGSEGQYLKISSGVPAWGAVSAGGLAWYGDGSDGDVTVSGSTTLSREMVYNSLTVTGSGVLDMNGWPIRVLTTLTVQSGGRVHCDGYAASGSTGGLARPDNYLGGSTAGSNGSGTNAAGASSITNSAGGGAGGTGGSGSGGAYFGGSGGTRSLLAAMYGSYRAAPLAITQYLYNPLLRGGAGGGGGGGNGIGGSGGGGGAGGGRAIIIAYAVSNSGTISVNGSAGVNATNSNTGGGGGGGGGSITVAYRTYSGSDPTASGGAGGTGNGNGTAGAAGAAGLVLKLQL